jgi:hypothetical protein
MSYYPLYGNVFVDSPNTGALGGTLSITNSENSRTLGNEASIAFGIVDVSYGILGRGLIQSGVDTADARISALIDTVTPNVGTAMTFKISGNSQLPPTESMRISSSGNIGIGTQTPKYTLDISGSTNTIGDTITNAMVEKYSTGPTVSSNASFTVPYSTMSNIMTITPYSATNMTLNITGLPTTRGSAIYDFTFIINTTPYKQYINTLNVNGTSATMKYANGSSSISISTATYVIQTISIQMNISTVLNVFTNVTGFS